jgi:hypothetical protein
MAGFKLGDRVWVKWRAGTHVPPEIDPVSEIMFLLLRIPLLHCTNAEV